MEQGLDALEREAGGFDDLLDLGTIAIAAMLGYFDFRFKAEAWRNNRSKLAAWYETFSKRPSFQSTLPPA
jgi:glutathione S-transferase